MNIKKQRYEAVFRWDDKDRLQGGNIRYITIYSDPSGEPVPAPLIGPAIPIALIGSDDFSLSAIFSEVQAEAVASVSRISAENAEVREALRVSEEKSVGLLQTVSRAESRLASMNAELEQRAAIIVQLKAQLEAR